MTIELIALIQDNSKFELLKVSPLSRALIIYEKNENLQDWNKLCICWWPQCLRVFLEHNN